MPQTVISVSLDSYKLQMARDLVRDDARLEFIITSLITRELDRLAAERGIVTEWKQIRTEPVYTTIRCYKDDQFNVWCAWIDICKATQLSNPYLGIEKMPYLVQACEHTRPGRHELRLVRPLDAAERLERRSTKKQLSTEVVVKLRALALLDGSPPVY